MPALFLRGLTAGCLVCLLSSAVSAQQGGTGEVDTGTATGGDEGATGDFGRLDPDQIFSAVERGDTVGGNTATVGREDSAGGGGGLGGGAAGLGGLGGGGLGGLGGLGSLFGAFNTGTAQSTRPAIRTRLRSAINVPPMSVPQVQANATRRFRSVTSRPSLSGINVTMQDRTAIISGVVASPSDRRMSELLIRLEPGVSRVENQVIVSPQSPADR